MVLNSESILKNFGVIRVVVFRYLYFGLTAISFNDLFLSCSCLFVLLVLTTHWVLECTDDVVGISGLPRYWGFGLQ